MRILSRMFSRFNISESRQNVLRNLSWAVLGKIINVLSSLLVGVLVARYLGPSSFGLMNYIISYVTLFSILSNFGLDNIEIRELSKPASDNNQILGTAFALRVSFAIGTLLLIIATLLIFETEWDVIYMVMVYSLSLFFGSLNVIRNYFTSIVLNEYVVKTEITRTIIGSAIKVILLIIKAPLEWFILAITFDFLLIASGYILAYNKKVGSFKNWKFNKELAFYLIKESFPILLSGAAIVIYQRIDQVMLKNMIDDAAVGQFSVASKITEIGIFIPTIIAQTITPILVRSHQENKQVYILQRKMFIEYMLWGSIILSFFISALARPTVMILFGDEYLESIPALQIMAWKIVLISLFISSAQIIIIEGVQKYAVIRNIIGSVISVVLNLILIPQYGIIGSVWAMIAAFAFSSYFSHLFIKPYNFIFKIQTVAFISGWKDLLKQGLSFKKNFRLSKEYK